MIEKLKNQIRGLKNLSDKKNKYDWKYLMSLPKYQRDWEIKKMAKKEKEEDEVKRPNK